MTIAGRAGSTPARGTNLIIMTINYPARIYVYSYPTEQLIRGYIYKCKLNTETRANKTTYMCEFLYSTHLNEVVKCHIASEEYIEKVISLFLDKDWECDKSIIKINEIKKPAHASQKKIKRASWRKARALQ